MKYFLIGMGIVIGIILTSSVVSIALDLRKGIAYLGEISNAFYEAENPIMITYPHD